MTRALVALVSLALAAPAFAAAAVGGNVVASLPVGTRVLVVSRLAVDADSAAAGRTIADLDRPGRCRPFLVRRAAGDGWFPPPSDAIAPGDDVYLIATRAGVADVVAMAAPPGA